MNTSTTNTKHASYLSHGTRACFLLSLVAGALGFGLAGPEISGVAKVAFFSLVFLFFVGVIRRRARSQQ